MIITPRLKLHPKIFMDDAALFAKWLNDPEVVKYSEQRHRKHTEETQRDYWNSAATVEPNLVCMIWDASQDGIRTIGSISATVDQNNNVANVGILIGDKTQWQKGYGLEAWKHFCNYLFEEKKIRKIEAGCMSINYPMVKICIRSGMNPEAEIPQHFVYEGKPTTMFLFGKLAP